MKLNINGKIIEVDNEALSKALEENKESIEVKSDLVVRTSEEDSQYRDNLKEEAVKPAYEIARKEILKEVGISKEGAHKSSDSAAKAIHAFAKEAATKAVEEAGANPDKRVTELTNDLDVLKGKLTEKDTEYQTLQSKFDSEVQGFKKTSTVMPLISSKVTDPDLAMMAFNSKVKVGFDESGQMYGIGADGQPLKDDLRNNLPIEKVVNNFLDTIPALLKKPEGGAGGGDSHAGGAKQTLNEFIDEMKEKKIVPNSPEFNQEKNSRLETGSLEIPV